MSDKIYIGGAAKSVDSSPAFDTISKVVLIVNDDAQFVAGNDSGRTLEVKVPWGDADMAQDILDRVSRFQYQPFSAKGAIFDPAAELGDGVTLAGIYAGLYQQRTTFGTLMASDIGAPGEEEVDHEYPYEAKQNREYTRKFDNIGSRITQNASMIQTEVTNRTAGDADLQSLITATAESITASVASTYVTNTTFNGAIQNLQDQIDDVIESWSGDYVPTLNNAPAVSWTTDALKREHVGDLFLDTSNSVYYRFQYNENDGYSWVVVQDTDLSYILGQLNDLDNELHNQYSTTTEMNSAIEQSAAGITATVNRTIEMLQIGGRNYLLKSTNETTVNKTTTTAKSTDLPFDTALKSLDDREFVFSFDGKSDNADLPCDFYFRSSGGTVLSDNSASKYLKLTTDYKRYEYKVKMKGSHTPAEIVYCRFRLPSGSETGSISIKNVKLEVGNYATDWTPNPSEYSTTAEMNSAITQTADGIRTEVSRKVGSDEVISSINQSAESIQINASRVALNGYVTISNLDDRGYVSESDLATAGQTVINGGNITTGEISADRVRGGTFVVGGYNDRSGVIDIYDASAALVGKLSNTGLVTINGNYRTWVSKNGFLSGKYTNGTYGNLATLHRGISSQTSTDCGALNLYSIDSNGNSTLNVFLTGDGNLSCKRAYADTVSVKGGTSYYSALWTSLLYNGILDNNGTFTATVPSDMRFVIVAFYTASESGDGGPYMSIIPRLYYMASPASEVRIVCAGDYFRVKCQLSSNTLTFTKLSGGYKRLRVIGVR